jgi:hypothetical protein
MSLLFNPHRLSTKIKGRTYTTLTAYSKDIQKASEYLASTTLFRLREKVDAERMLKAVFTIGPGYAVAHEFYPSLARNMALRYKCTPNSRVLDPCGGWGGRMIGFSTVVDHYTCFEPETRTHAGLCKLYEFIKLMRPNFKAEVNKVCFEDCKIKKGYYDFALTSPPYYDMEIYSQEETNSTNRYKTFDTWCDGFYLPLIENTMQQLKPGAPFVLDISSRVYPLSAVLKSNFSKKYRVRKLSGGHIHHGLRDNLDADSDDSFWEVSNK